MGWTDWNWINVALVFVNGAVAYDCFADKDVDRSFGGWLNVFASSLNAAMIAIKVL